MLLFQQALNYSEDMLSQREVVAVDISSEQPSNSEYKPELVSYRASTRHLFGKSISAWFHVVIMYSSVVQDCTKFKSSKTGRGPLGEGWKVSCMYSMHECKGHILFTLVYVINLCFGHFIGCALDF